MTIVHATVKAAGQRLFAIPDWNAAHDVAGFTSTGDIIVNKANPIVRLDGSGTAEFTATVDTLNLTNTETPGNVSILIDPIPGDGTSKSFVKFFRNVNTTEEKQFIVYKGDNSATITFRMYGESGIISTCGGAAITQTATTGNALSVSRDLAAASTDSPVVKFVQDNTGDDQPVLEIQQDETLVEAVNFSAGTIAFNFATAMASVGANTMAVNNSPGAGTTTWISCEVNGVAGFIPFHFAS